LVELDTKKAAIKANTDHLSIFSIS